MQFLQLHAIGEGIFKTLDDLNPDFLKEIFYCPQNLTQRKCNIYVYSQNTKKNGNKVPFKHLYRTRCLKTFSLQNGFTNSKILQEIGQVLLVNAVYVVNVIRNDFDKSSKLFI